MIRGKVSGNQQALIAVEIIDGDGRPRSVDSDPLLGMALLWGSRVTLDALNDGEVAIEELSPAPLR